MEERMKTVRVRMLTNVAGTPAYYAGQVTELEEKIAEAWIAEGMARRLAPGESTDEKGGAR